MPDITMCVNYGCPLKDTCLRSKHSGTKPSKWQSWAFFEFTIEGETVKCKVYAPRKDKDD